MQTEEALQLLDDQAFLDTLFGYAYKRCSNSYEAEDLCSEIVVALLHSIRKQPAIEHFHGFVWTIAQRVYADFSEKRRQRAARAAYTDVRLSSTIDAIDELINSEYDAFMLNRIRREIAFLSKMYRDVMVMYYLDERKTSDIARTLGISETTVKQRLFSARNAIRKEVEKMDITSLALKPIRLIFVGSGRPVGNDPRTKAERRFSQNLVYLCKNTARSAKELSELLHVPMPFIEDELEIQCRGENGHYGLLRKLDNNRYISNIIMLDAADYRKVQAEYNQYTTKVALQIKNYLDQNQQAILGFPFLIKQSDLSFIAWSLISRMVWSFEGRLQQWLTDNYYASIARTEREFYTFGFAVREDEDIEIGFYGCDGISASNICGYRQVFASNIYGRRIQKHFSCGHNISQDPAMMMALNAVGGLAIETLTEEDKEIASKAIEAGYLRKEAGQLYPKILMVDAADEVALHALASGFAQTVDSLVEPMADALHGFIQQYVPQHLIGEYHQFVLQATAGFIGAVIEQCIDNGALHVPETPFCAEGTWMVVHK
ncbi:hypothetical protein PCCS19_42750 [Paenibacillus sp. CCS19]|uniref:RNA polymerase sigma factor n=1 Tax=Paenibacillus sp. CCS19 TaxID=3158387 RepID=UPI00255F0284|nr:RNA polymerase sigma factor [Paenibacillus cellulosilyticus]GMK41219.1 hypothetical protein PCCS19_42750 [Paenibacillus cellulosilyticus]